MTATCHGFCGRRYTPAEMDRQRIDRELLVLRCRARKRMSRDNRIGVLIGSLDWMAERAALDAEEKALQQLLEECAL